MKISTNQNFIERNIKISKYILYFSLALLAIGFIWSIKNTDPDKTIIGWIILIPSYFLVQVSIFMANKWGKSPRPDEIVAQSLKGLNNEFYLYNFSTAVPHLLVGPIGIWIINPYHQRGVISYNSKKMKYEQEGGPGIIGKYFGQEGLPKISRDVKNLRSDLIKYFKDFSISFDVEPQVINIFYAEDVQISGKDFPVVSIKADKLKDRVRKEAKKRILSAEEITRICEYLPEID